MMLIQQRGRYCSSFSGKTDVTIPCSDKPVRMEITPHTKIGFSPKLMTERKNKQTSDDKIVEIKN